MITFESQCTTNLNKYLTAIGNDFKPGKGISLTPVFTTKLGRTKFHAVENKTKAQISSMIVEGINEIKINGDVDEALMLTARWEKTKSKH